MKQTIYMEFSELSCNGDEESNDSVLEVLSRHLSDKWTLIGVYDLSEEDDESDNAFWAAIHPLHVDALKLIKPAEHDGEAYYYQCGFVFQIEPDTPASELEKALVDLEEMGRYPASESEGDDFMVSFSHTIYRNEKYVILEYWFDDSTR